MPAPLTPETSKFSVGNDGVVVTSSQIHRIQQQHSRKKSVTFSDPIEQNAAYPCTLESMTIYVSETLSSFQKGDTVNYYNLVQDIEKGTLASDQTKLIIQAISNQISSIQNSMKKLISALLSLEWMTSSFSTIYQHFLENLVSSNSTFAAPVCKMLISYLCRGTQVLPQIPPSTLFSTIHECLSRILKLIPSGPSLLLPILIAKYPHKTSPLDYHLLYVKSLLHIMEYVPVLQKPIIALIVDGMVQIDVEVQIELEDLDEEQIESVQSLVSKIDDLDTLSSHLNEEGKANDTISTPQDGQLSTDEIPDFNNEGENDGYESDDEYSVTSQIISTDIIPMIQKLDALMTLMFQHFEQMSVKIKEGAISYDTLHLQFTYMLDAFDSILLTTHRVRCVQFLVFYLSSLSPDFPEQFLGLLVSRTFSTDVSPVVRVCASAYLASYVARATFIPFEHVRMAIKLLTDFAIKYIDAHDSKSLSGSLFFTTSKLDIDKHSIFYAVTQAILYIFCFKWRELQMTPEQMPLIGRFAPELSDFQSVLLSRLSPLRICSQTIVEEFAKITLHLDIMYCYSMMYPNTPSPDVSRTNSRRSDAMTDSSDDTAPSTSCTDNGTSKANSGQQSQPSPPRSVSLVERLDTFFPFDPLSLPRSRHFLDGLYQEWQSEDDDESENSDSQDDDESDDFAKELGLFADDEDQDEENDPEDDEGERSDSSADSLKSAEAHVMDYISNAGQIVL